MVRFRDGSRIRLFRNTRLMLKEAKERPTQKRSFKVGLLLKQGMMQGRFQPEYQLASIRTPDALIGIKGTSIRLSYDSRTGTTLSLSQGLLEVSNKGTSVEINPGEWLPAFRNTDDLIQRVQALPFKLHLKTEDYRLDFASGTLPRIFLTIQSIDSINGKDVRKPGAILLESDYAGARIPSQVQLDDNGYTRLPIDFDPPSPQKEIPALIRLYATMDTADYEDVGDGLLVLKLLVDPETKRFLFDPARDEIKQMP